MRDHTAGIIQRLFDEGQLQVAEVLFEIDTAAG